MSDLSESVEGRAPAPALQVLRVGNDIAIPLEHIAAAVRGEVRIVQNQAEVDPDLAPVLALVFDPVTDLALRIAGRTDAEDVLSEWTSAARSLLKWHGRSRRRITLCDIRALAGTGTDSLMERLGVASEPSEPIAQDLLPQPADFDLIAARVLLDGDRQAGALAEQLTASMIGPGRVAIPAALVRRIRLDRQALDARLDDIARSSEAERQQAQAALAERDASLEALQTRMAALDEKSAGLATALEQAAETAAAERKQHAQALSEKEQGLVALRAEMDRLETERGLLHENLDLQMQAGAAATAEAEATRDEASAQKAEADRLREALSEREQALAALRNEVEKLTTERDLLSENLGLQVKDIASAKAEAEVRNGELAQIRKTLSEREQALAALRGEMDRTGTERDLLRENLSLQMEVLGNPGTARMEQENAELRARTVDFHLLKAEKEAMERRLAETQERQARREAVLTAQLLLDGLPPWKA